MKGPFLLTLYVTLCVSASAQVNVDSVQQDVDAVLNKVTVDSLQQHVTRTLNTLDVDSLQAGLRQLPDSLMPAYRKIDSIRNAFNGAADSIQQEYHHSLSRIDSAAHKIQRTIDSASHLNLSTARYTKALDSLNSLRRRLEKKFTSRLDDIKSKTIEKVNGLDLPAEYKEPIQRLTGKIDGLSLHGDVLNIPPLDVPGFSLPKIDGLPDIASEAGQIPDLASAGKLPGIKTPGGDFGAVTQQAQKYQDDIRNLADGNLQDVKKLPETIEQQASKIDGMEEIQKQSGVVDQYKGKVEALSDPEKGKEKAIELGKKAAIDHFAGKQEQLKAAMEKVAKYKQKYSSVSSIKDLPKRPPNPMKGKPFVTRLVPGLFLQYQQKDYFLLDINPYVGYKLSGRFTSGVGWNHRYAYDRDIHIFDSRSRIFGPRAYVDCKLGKGFIGHVEGECMNTFVPSTLLSNPDTGEREWVWSFMTGIKKEYRIYRNLRGTALIQYNLFNRHYKAPYVDRLNSRIGFEYVINAKKKRNQAKGK